MSISYDPLWEMLNNLGVTKMELAKMIDISNATLAKLSKNEPITLTIVDRICNRFNCKIENVIKHIPDIRITHSTFLVEKGMIVLCEDFSSRTKVEGTTSMYHIKKRPHLVLDIVTPSMDNDPHKVAQCKNEDLMYAIAPMYTSSPNTPSPLNVSFSNVEISNELTSGYVSFGDIHIVCSGLFDSKLGIMPEKYMDKFDKILETVLEVTEDV